MVCHLLLIAAYFTFYSVDVPEFAGRGDSDVEYDHQLSEQYVQWSVILSGYGGQRYASRITRVRMQIESGRLRMRVRLCGPTGRRLSTLKSLSEIGSCIIPHALTIG